MKTVQMTLDETLVAAVDVAARRLKTTRSAFTRQALQVALDLLRTEDKERRHRAGYAKKPASPRDLGRWDREQAWGDK
jgi:metal-responsive CopG/Arc/MetJ family transcriptional regulator